MKGCNWLHERRLKENCYDSNSPCPKCGYTFKTVKYDNKAIVEADSLATTRERCGYTERVLPLDYPGSLPYIPPVNNCGNCRFMEIACSVKAKASPDDAGTTNYYICVRHGSTPLPES